MVLLDAWPKASPIRNMSWSNKNGMAPIRRRVTMRGGLDFGVHTCVLCMEKDVASPTRKAMRVKMNSE